jgi:hypothetical protein
LTRALFGLGGAEHEAGDLARAEELYTQALELARAAGLSNVPPIEHSLGVVALDRRDLATARERFRSALAAVAVDETHGACNCVAGLAAVDACEGRVERAGRLWGAVEAVERERGTQIIAHERRRYEVALAAIAGAELDVAVAAGHALIVERAVEEALAST